MHSCRRSPRVARGFFCGAPHIGQISADAAAGVIGYALARELRHGRAHRRISDPGHEGRGATCSTAQQQRAPDSISTASCRECVSLAGGGWLERIGRRARLVHIRQRKQRSKEYDKEPNRNLPRCSAAGRVPWPDFRTIKGAPPNACAWPTKPPTRQTRPCSSKWLKPGPSLPSRRRPEAATTNRNRSRSRERARVALPGQLPPQWTSQSRRQNRFLGTDRRRVASA